MPRKHPYFTKNNSIVLYAHQAIFGPIPAPLISQ